jgi:hypothetical protein
VYIEMGIGSRFMLMRPFLHGTKKNENFENLDGCRSCRVDEGSNFGSSEKNVNESIFSGLFEI